MVAKPDALITRQRRNCNRPGCGKRTYGSWFCSKACREECSPWKWAYPKIAPAPGTNPRPAIPWKDPNQVTRKTDCAKYGRCLDVALGEHWASFTCRYCRGHEARDRDDLRRDMDGLIALAGEICR